MGKKKNVLEDKELRALCIPLPDGLDRYFRHPSDGDNDFTTAYTRAADFAAQLGDTLVAHLWQEALEIGFRAGAADANASRQGDTSDVFALGRQAGLAEGRAAGLREGRQEGRELGSSEGLKEGEIIGVEKGKAEGVKEGLSEGKRLGFVAGREFAEKQTAKMSEDSIPLRILVDVGTDSPAVDLSPPTPPSPAPVSASIDPAVPPATSSAPFNWADEPDVPRVTNALPCLPLPPRDFSALHSDSTSLTPFGTLRYRTYRTHKSSRAPRRSASRATFSRQYPAAPAPFHHAPTASFASRPFSAASAPVLDWDSDPRLSELSRVLRSMGWDRGRGGGVA